MSIADLESLENIEAMWAAEKARLKAKDAPATQTVMPAIPAARYHAHEFHELENEHVFRRTWMFVGHFSEFPETGSYLTRDVAGVPVIVVRTKDGSCRAFINVCMHRGARLLQEERGCVRQINCPYHCWTYGLEGKLEFVPGKADFNGIDLSTRNLREVACEEFRGLVFIALDLPEQSLDQFLGGMKEALADVALEGATLFHRLVVPADCNWKCVQDAFSESYHVSFVHANSVNQAIDPQCTARYMLRGGHSAMIVRSRMFEGGDAKNVFDRGTDAKADKGQSESSMRPVTSVSQRSYNIFPNLTVPIAENLFPIMAIWPTGPESCDFELRMMKLPDSQTDEATDREVTDAFIAILYEDLGALKGMQQSLVSGAVPELALGHGEQFIANYQLELDAHIGGENIPEQLKIRETELQLY